MASLQRRASRFFSHLYGLTVLLIVGAVGSQTYPYQPARDAHPWLRRRRRSHWQAGSGRSRLKESTILVDHSPIGVRLPNVIGQVRSHSI